MKALLITIPILFAAIPHGAHADPETMTVEEAQATIDKVKSFMDSIEKDVNKQLFQDIEATSPNAKRFRTMLISFLQYGIVDKGKHFGEFEITDIYMCAAGVCDEISVEELVELKTLFEEANISEGIDDLKQVIPNAVAISAVGSHWVRARNLMRIAVKHVKQGVR